mmetsp:Transcript_21091/g.28999  ORF Transcript_21091/g.28999 Transcript_21091/m.28999 type:complete len:99 (+) Transcript_21091:362-658(+)
MGITSSCLNREDTSFHRKNTHIECATTKIKDNDIGLVLRSRAVGTSGVQSICQSCSSRLIDYSHNIKPRYSASILCGLSLLIIKMGRNSNDSFFHGHI